MTGPPFDISLLRWLISARDFRIHAFYDADPRSGFLKALCPHSVSPDRIVGPDDTSLTPERCMKCQQLLADILAGMLGDGTNRTK